MSLTTDKVQAMPILEDPADNVGKPLSFKEEGDPTAGGNYAGMLVGKDPSDNLQFLSLNANNEVIVDADSAEVACLTGSAKVTGGTSEVTVLDVSLVAGREYQKVGWIGSNFRQTEYRIVHIDDPAGTPVEVELATFLVGPGAYTSAEQLDCLSFTAPATDPVLRLYGTNKDAASDLRGTLSVEEIQ
jgi:hypothetical protein